VIAVMLMAVIAISSAAALRSVINQEKTGQNLRLQLMAKQSAEGMLRLCESALITANPSVIQQQIRGLRQAPKQPRHWETMANWDIGSNVIFDLPASANLTGIANGRRPQCLVEMTSRVNADRSGVSSPTRVIAIVTARGFSPDFLEDAGRIPTQGAQYWLQSTIDVDISLAL
jgi:hypothetical protein